MSSSGRARSPGVFSRWWRRYESVRSTGSRSSVNVVNGASEQLDGAQGKVPGHDAESPLAEPSTVRARWSTERTVAGGVPSSGSRIHRRRRELVFSRRQSAVPAVFWRCTKKKRRWSFIECARSLDPTEETTGVERQPVLLPRSVLHEAAMQREDAAHGFGGPGPVARATRDARSRSCSRRRRTTRRERAARARRTRARSAVRRRWNPGSPARADGRRSGPARGRSCRPHGAVPRRSVIRGCSGRGLRSSLTESTRPWPRRSQTEARKTRGRRPRSAVSMIQSGRTSASNSWYTIRSVGAAVTGSPSQVVCFHDRPRQ